MPLFIYTSSPLNGFPSGEIPDSSEELEIDLKHSVYALDSTTIDLCLSLFPWATFRKTKGAIKLHALLDLRGSIPTFIRRPGRAIERWQ